MNIKVLYILNSDVMGGATISFLNMNRISSTGISFLDSLAFTISVYLSAPKFMSSKKINKV